MRITPINKNYEHSDMLRDDYLDVRSKIRDEENGLAIEYSAHNVEWGGGVHRSRDWELCTMILGTNCLLYTSPSPRDGLLSRMPSSA